MNHVDADDRDEVLRAPENKGARHCISAVAFVVAGGGFEPPTFGL
jgi:hypothetical protein